MPVLEGEEYIEQAYFFHSFRDRLGGWAACGKRSWPGSARAALDHQASPGRLVPVCRGQGIRPDVAGDGAISHYFSGV